MGGRVSGRAFGVAVPYLTLTVHVLVPPTCKWEIAYLGCGGILMNSLRVDVEMHSHQLDKNQSESKDERFANKTTCVAVNGLSLHA